MLSDLKIMKQKNFFLKKYVLLLKIILKTVIKEIRLKNNDIELKTTPNNIRSLLYFLQNHTLCQYKQLVDIACSDILGKTRRFSVNYLLLSLRFNVRLMIVVKTNEVLPLPSTTFLYRSANWLEREVWDLFGVFFDSHPDLRRILTDYGFNGHPLRKDFPLTGFSEIYYNDSIKRLNYEPVELAQEYRVFTLQSPWVQSDQKIQTEQQQTKDSKSSVNEIAPVNERPTVKKEVEKEIKKEIKDEMKEKEDAIAKKKARFLAVFAANEEEFHRVLLKKLGPDLWFLTAQGLERDSDRADSLLINDTRTRAQKSADKERRVRIGLYEAIGWDKRTIDDIYDFVRIRTPKSEAKLNAQYNDYLDKLVNATIMQQPILVYKPDHYEDD